MKKQTIILLSIFFFAILLRIFSINHTLFNDEGRPVLAIASEDSKAIFFAHDSGHPPFSNWMYYLFYFFLGDHTYTYRLTSLFFSLLSIFLTYLIAKKEFTEEIALFSVGLLALSAWFVITSIQIHIDAPFMIFFYLLLLFLFLKYNETEEKKYLIYLGITFLFALLTKETAILGAVLVFFFHFFRSKERWNYKPYFYLSGVFIIAFILFLGFLAFTHIETKGTTLLVFDIESLKNEYVSGTTTPTGLPFTLKLIQYTLPFFLLTPLLIGLCLINFQDYLKKKEQYLPYILWIFFIFGFYSFAISGVSQSFERWLIAILPPLAILGGIALEKIHLKKMDWTLLIITTLTAFFAFILFSTIHPTNLTFYPKEAFLSQVKSVDWNFLVPILGNASPLGFYIHFGISIFVWIFSTLLIFFYFVLKDVNIKKKILILFLAMSLGLNLLIIEEHSFGYLYGSTDDISKELIHWVNTHPVKEPVYVFRNTMINAYYRSTNDTFTRKEKYLTMKSNYRTLDFSNENNIQKIQELQREHALILILDFPKINKNSLLWQNLLSCKKEAIFFSQKEEMGFVFQC